MDRSRIWKFNKYDFILTAVLVAVSVLLFVFMITVRGDAPGRTVVITVNGTLYGEYDLNTDREIRIETDLGMNLIVIENGGVCVKEADCPDGYCVSDGFISRKGETLVCLPHRVVVEIRSEIPDENEIDAIAQ